MLEVAALVEHILLDGDEGAVLFGHDARPPGHVVDERDPPKGVPGVVEDMLFLFSLFHVIDLHAVGSFQYDEEVLPGVSLLEYDPVL